MHSGKSSRFCVGSLFPHSPLLTPTAQLRADVFLCSDNGTSSAEAGCKALVLLWAAEAALGSLQCRCVLQPLCGSRT